MRRLSRVLPPLLALSLLAVPAGAEVYRVTLANGQSFESTYQPQEASWDAGMVLLMTDVGNWIGIAKADIQQVETVNDTGGYGVQIAANTFELGISANDAEAEEEAALAAAGGGGTGAAGQAAAPDPRLQMIQLMQQQQAAETQQRAAERSYSVQQFVEPGQTQGIPSRFIGTPNGNPPQK